MRARSGMLKYWGKKRINERGAVLAVPVIGACWGVCDSSDRTSGGVVAGVAICAARCCGCVCVLSATFISLCECGGVCG